MTRRRGWIASVCAVLALARFAGAEPKSFSIVSAGPQGEVRTIEEANEVRVVFSEPMVALGKIPRHVVAPFFHLEPDTAGTFRWSGTTTLIFRPAHRFPFGTRYVVTIDATAKSTAGAGLGKPFSFSFVTPAVRLSSVAFYRENERANGRVVLILDFNQPVRGTSVRPLISIHRVPREASEEELAEPPVDAYANWSPEDKAAYRRRREEAEHAIHASAEIGFELAPEWDKKTYPPGKERVVVRTEESVAPGSRLAVTVNGAAETSESIDLPPAFFLTKLTCTEKCDPDYGDALLFSSDVSLEELRAHTVVRDVTIRGNEKALPRSRRRYEPSESGEAEGDGGGEPPDVSRSFALTDLGFDLLPARTYEVTIDRRLESADGQRLGYDWTGRVELWHRTAFASFETGYGVWESSGGPTLPFSVRNLTGVSQWMAPLTLSDLVPTALKLEKPPDQNGGTPDLPPGSPSLRELHPKPDVTAAIGLDLSKSLNASGTGMVWTAVKPAGAILNSRLDSDVSLSTIVQVTNLGLSVKDSPDGTLVFVTRLDDGKPVSGARVAIRKLDNSVAWEGETNSQGVAMAPAADLRKDENLWQLAFFVTAAKGDDVAFAASNWNEGIQPWDFNGVTFDAEDAKPMLRGSVFTDRGVYRLGEETHVKMILRSDTPRGIVLFPAATDVAIEVKNSQNEVIDTRRVRLSEWSSADWTMKLADEGPLGTYRIAAKVAGQTKEIDGSFLVASYRRPDFRVDAALSADAPIAGTKLEGKIAARYLFGAVMGKAPVRWSLSRTRVFAPPEKIADRFPEDQYAFLGWLTDEDQNESARQEVESHEDVLDVSGTFDKSFKTPADLGAPFRYELEGEVTDVSRQAIAGRAETIVHPAPWYVGVARPPYFVDTAKGFDTRLLAATLDGGLASGVKIEVTLAKVQWSSVRRLEAGGFATWETQKKEIPSGTWNVTTSSDPVPLHVTVPDGGYFVLRAQARDTEGHLTRTEVDFYAVGAGYTAWQRYDHNRIDLVPEKTRYRPGDTARILIKSPWDRATALLTTEREGIRTWRQFELTSTQQTVSVPIEEKDIPNLFVSVLLIRGRTSNFDPKDVSDPGKPSFRLGYARLEIADQRKRLAVSVASDRDEYRPAAKARVRVEVKDVAGSPAPSEVALWAVDQGVLSLTGYQPPDLANSVYVPKSLAVLNEDSRQRIISRRVLTPKGAADGGGGGNAAGAGDQIRKDFRVLAFWLGSVATDSSGHATAEVKLPESLTAYRIMAVASDKLSRFGSGAHEIRISKPVLLKAAFPRFLAVGDRAFFGAVVVNQLKKPGSADVSLKSLDPDILDLPDSASQKVPVDAGGSAEARFPFVAKRPGRARLLASVRMNGESDSFQDSLPVEVLVSPEVVAAYGQTDARAEEKLAVPAGVIDSFGGLDVSLSSTALVGLSEGARYLIDYPYGCAEQRASAALALALASELGASFHLPGIDSAKLREITQATLQELKQFQGGDGGFLYWKGETGPSSPYLTAWVLHVEEVARRLKFDVDSKSFERGVDFLDHEIGAETPPSDEMRFVWFAWQAFGVKVLAEAGRRVDSPVERLAAAADRMPLFSIADLADAATASGNAGGRREELIRRIQNGILNEAGASHVEEIDDPALLWIWSSNVRSTAQALETLVSGGADETVAASLLRWLLDARRDGRWGNTQENAAVMEALVAYFRKFENVPPDFSAAVTLAGAEIAREEFRASSDESRTRVIPMRELAPKAAGRPATLAFEKTGVGKLFYTTRLAYAPSELPKEPLDAGISIERSYAPDAGGPEAKTFHAGDLIRVTLKIQLTKERRFVAVSDPLPAGFEPVESWFATTASMLGRRAESENGGGEDWLTRWRRGGFDHVERRDDRVNLFATRLSEGSHSFSYLVRATTAGTFSAAPARAEEMYRPEVFGRTAADVIEVAR